MEEIDSLEIGTIVKSNSHVEFVCQVLADGEVDDPPDAATYAFGTLVAVEMQDAASELVGVVFDTILFNPDFGSAGPRIRPQIESDRLTPDRYADTATLVGIIALGMSGRDNSVLHGVTSTSPFIGARVRALQDGEIVDFHEPNGRFTVGYVPHLLAHGHPLIEQLLLNLSDRLARLFPEESAALSVIRNNLAWKLKVEQSK